MKRLFRVTAVAAVLSASALAHAEVSLSANLTQFSYQVRSIGAAAGSAPGISFGNSVLQSSLGQQLQDDDGVWWTYPTFVDAASLGLNEAVGSLTSTQSVSNSATRDYGQIQYQLSTGAGGASMSVSSVLKASSAPGGVTQTVATSGGMLTYDTSFTLSAHSYVAFKAISDISVLADALPMSTKHLTNQMGGVNVSLTTSGPASNGLPNTMQSSSVRDSAYFSGLSLVQNAHQTKTLIAYFYNNTDSTLTGQLDAMIQPNATLTLDVTPVPEADTGALALAGLGAVATILRQRSRRARRIAGHGAAAVTAVAAGLALGLAPEAHAATTASANVNATISLSQIQLSTYALDADAGVSPVLTPLAAGAYVGNRANASLSTQDLSRLDPNDPWSSAYASTDGQTQTLPAGGIFDIPSLSVQASGSTLSVSSASSAQGPSYLLTADLHSNEAVPSANGYLQWSAGFGDPAAVSPTSFKLSAHSYATLSMLVDLKASFTATPLAPDAGDQAGYASGFLNFMMAERLSGDSIGFNETGSFSFNVMAGQDPYHLSQVMTFSLFNPGDTEMTGLLDMNAFLQANVATTIYPPVSGVPEPQDGLLALAGLVTLLASRRATRR